MKWLETQRLRGNLKCWAWKNIKILFTEEAKEHYLGFLCFSSVSGQKQWTVNKNNAEYREEMCFL